MVIQPNEILNTIHTNTQNLCKGTFDGRISDGCILAAICVILLISIVSMALSIVNACHHY